MARMKVANASARTTVGVLTMHNGHPQADHTDTPIHTLAAADHR